jgi:hypothetical protein
MIILLGETAPAATQYEHFAHGVEPAVIRPAAWKLPRRSCHRAVGRQAVPTLCSKATESKVNKTVVRTLFASTNGAAMRPGNNANDDGDD